MSHTRTAERIAVLLVALARTVLCGYRAAQQSITIDEATTYLTYVREHWANVWSHYDANNHILYSILAQLSVRALHISEFSLRLPSVLAGFFFVIGIHRVLEETVSSRATRWIALAAFCTAPLLLDFSVAARGYGLSLALLVWAIYFSIRGRDLWSGVFVGLSVASNFNIAFPAAGLVAAPLVFAEGSLERRLLQCAKVALPAAAIFGVICYPALIDVEAKQFYVGLPTIRESLFELIFTFIRAAPGKLGWFGTGVGTRAVQYFFLPALMLFSILVSARAFLKKQGSPRAGVPVLVLLTALAAIVYAHLVYHLNYPVDRTGLALFVLFGLAWAIAVSQVGDWRIRAVNGVLAALLTGQFLTQFHTRYFMLWEFELSMKQVAQKIRDDVRGKPPGSIAISATWYHASALEYYRVVYRLAALKPMKRLDDPAPLQDFDYYVVDGDVRNTPAVTRMVPLFRDDFSGVLLAKEP